MNENRLVGHGVDTLILNAYYMDERDRPVKRELDSVLAQQLDEWKKQAQYASEPIPVPWVFQDSCLQMYPNGAGRGHWQWLLRSPWLSLCISSGRWSGGIAQVRFSSDYLWSSHSLTDAILDVHDFLSEVFGSFLSLQTSEIHLCADVVGWQEIADLDYRQVFVSRSHKRSDHAEADWSIEPGDDFKAESFSYGLKRTGLAFSARGSLSCAIYDKTRELKKSGKEWFEDLWRTNGWTDGEQVWRVEFRFKREALHELKQEDVFHGIEDAFDLPDRLAVLWAYAAGQVGGGADGSPDGWLRYAIPNGGKNRSRWPTHPTWKLIQNAFTQPCEVPEQFGKIVRKRREEHSIQKGIEATMGYATSLSAWIGEALADPDVDLSVFLHWLAINGEEYLQRKDTAFGAEVQRKRVRLGLQAS